MTQNYQLGLVGQTFAVNTSSNSASVNSNLTVSGNVTFSTNTFTIGTAAYFLANGNVGIGTTSPSKKFVVSSGGAAGFEVAANEGSSNAIRLICYNRSTSSYVAGGLEATALTFSTGTGSSLPTSMYIDSSGNMGIGTTSPSNLLQVDKSQNAATVASVINTNTGASASAYFRVNSNDGNLYMISGSTASGGGSVIYCDNGTGSFLLKSYSAIPMIFGTNNTERMRIDSSGNMGIGTTSPSSIGGTLSVVGNGASGTGYFRNLATSGITSDQLQVSVAQSTSLSSVYLARFYNNVSASPTVVFHVLGDGSGYFAGNVGIGTTTPGSKLDIQSSSAGTATGLLKLYATNGSDRYAGIDFHAVTSESYNKIAQITAQVTNGGNGTGAAIGGDLIFRTNSSATNVPSERMRIDSSGRVTMPYQTGFQAQYGTIATQSWSGTAAFQALQLNGQATFGSRVTGYNTSTYRFTAPVAGMYMFYSRFTPTTNGQTGPEAIFSINGSGAYYAGINYSAAGVGSYVSTSGELLVQLAASDWVELRIINNNNVSFTLDLTRCVFGGYLVG